MQPLAWDYECERPNFRRLHPKSTVVSNGGQTMTEPARSRASGAQIPQQESQPHARSTLSCHAAYPWMPLEASICHFEPSVPSRTASPHISYLSTTGNSPSAQWMYQSPSCWLSTADRLRGRHISVVCCSRRCCYCRRERITYDKYDY